ncbi:MAG: diacylglycerol kinase family lipid kinase [Rikenellaceae bacterium]
MSRWFAIVNPVAGNCKGLTDWPLISKQLRDNHIEYDAVFTEKKYHATELCVEAVNKGYRQIIVVGGDGTLHETVHGLFIQKCVASTDVTLAVIAVGTGNDWIRMYGIPRKYSDAVKAIVIGNTFLQDVARVTYSEAMVDHTRYMANVAGVGFDAVVNRRYNNLKERGYYSKWLYVMSLVMTIFKYKSLHFTVCIDGEEVLTQKVFTGALGIGKYNGGGMLQTPNAIADDGLIDVTIIKKMNNLSIFGHIKKLYNGNIYDVPQSMFFRAANITIESDPVSPLEVDGEALGFSPTTFSVVPKALKVIIK